MSALAHGRIFRKRHHGGRGIVARDALRSEAGRGEVVQPLGKPRLFPRAAGGGRSPFCIVIPPPNVTGVLHMGHALNNTIQDILVALAPHAGAERAVDARHRPRRHRDAERRREGTGEAGTSGARTSAARSSSSASGSGARSTARASSASSRKLGCSCDWERDPVHDGRGPLARRARSVRHALRATG